MVLDPRKKMRFLKFSFSEIYGDEVVDKMIDLVWGTLVKVYDYYSCVDSQMCKCQVGVRGHT